MSLRTAAWMSPSSQTARSDHGRFSAPNHAMPSMKQHLRILVATLTLCLLSEMQAAETISLPAAEPDRVSARPEVTVTTLGFGSCARQERPQPIWDTINAARCDAFVLLGDNIYADTSDP